MKGRCLLSPTNLQALCVKKWNSVLSNRSVQHYDWGPRHRRLYATCRFSMDFHFDNVVVQFLLWWFHLNVLVCELVQICFFTALVPSINRFHIPPNVNDSISQNECIHEMDRMTIYLTWFKVMRNNKSSKMNIVSNYVLWSGPTSTSSFWFNRSGLELKCTSIQASKHPE